MADATAISVGKTPAIEKLRSEAGRVEAAECSLGVRGIGRAERADPPVAPGLRHQSDERVIAVVGLV